MSLYYVWRKDSLLEYLSFHCPERVSDPGNTEKANQCPDTANHRTHDEREWCGRDDRGHSTREEQPRAQQDRTPARTGASSSRTTPPAVTRLVIMKTTISAGGPAP